MTSKYCLLLVSLFVFLWAEPGCSKLPTIHLHFYLGKGLKSQKNHQLYQHKPYHQQPYQKHNYAETGFKDSTPPSPPYPSKAYEKQDYNEAGTEVTNRGKLENGNESVEKEEREPELEMGDEKEGEAGSGVVEEDKSRGDYLVGTYGSVKHGFPMPPHHMLHPKMPGSTNHHGEDYIVKEPTIMVKTISPRNKDEQTYDEDVAPEDAEQEKKDIENNNEGAEQWPPEEQEEEMRTGGKHDEGAEGGTEGDKDDYDHSRWGAGDWGPQKGISNGDEKDYNINVDGGIKNENEVDDVHNTETEGEKEDYHEKIREEEQKEQNRKEEEENQDEEEGQREADEGKQDYGQKRWGDEHKEESKDNDEEIAIGRGELGEAEREKEESGEKEDYHHKAWGGSKYHHARVQAGNLYVSKERDVDENENGSMETESSKEVDKENRVEEEERGYPDEENGIAENEVDYTAPEEGNDQQKDFGDYPPNLEGVDDPTDASADYGDFNPGYGKGYGHGVYGGPAYPAHGPFRPFPKPIPSRGGYPRPSSYPNHGGGYPRPGSYPNYGGYGPNPNYSGYPRLGVRD